ncbi:MAG: SRPBCC family protein [Myxococcota bacterium]
MSRRALLFVFGTLVAVPALLLAVGFLLPGEIRVERDVIVSADADQVFARLDSAKEWASYHRGERALGKLETFELTGLAEGKGSGIQYYVSDRLVASYTIREAKPPERIAYGFSWESAPVHGQGVFEISSVCDGTLVVRREIARIGPDPIYRWFALGLREAVAEDFDAFFKEFSKDFAQTRTQ